MISCFEIVTPHMSGQPFCNMSMDALEMIVTGEAKQFCCRLAKSGGDMFTYIYGSFYLVLMKGN